MAASMSRLFTHLVGVACLLMSVTASDQVKITSTPKYIETGLTKSLKIDCGVNTEDGALAHMAIRAQCGTDSRHHTLVTVEEGDICPDGWTVNPGTGLCYRYFAKKLTYANALKDCKAQGAQLAMATSEQENTFLFNLIKVDKEITSWGGIWLASNDIKKEGTWVWEDGKRVTWTNWKSGQPDNAGNNEDCNTLMSSGHWNDLPCANTGYSRYVCTKPNSVCPAGWLVNPVNRQCYQFIDKALTYKDATASCKAIGAEIPVVNSEQENTFLFDMIKPKGVSVWLAGSDVEKEGTFVWRNGKKLGWTNWNRGEPNNSGGDEDCFDMRVEDGKWNDVPCDETIKLVCTMFNSGQSVEKTSYLPNSAKVSGTLHRKKDDFPFLSVEIANPGADRGCRYACTATTQSGNNIIKDIEVLATDGALAAVSEKVNNLEKQLNNNANTLKNEIKNNVNALKNDIKNNVDKLENSIKNNVNQLRNENENDVKQLENKISNNFNELDNKIKTTFDTLDNKINNNMKTLGTDLTNKVNVVDNKIKNSVKNLNTRINNNAKELGNEIKNNRNELENKIKDNQNAAGKVMDCMKTKTANKYESLMSVLFSVSEPFNGFTYYLSQHSPSSYINAARSCKALGGTLAKLNSKRTFDFIKKFLQSHISDKQIVLIDGTDAETEGKFIKSNDTPLGYGEWFKGQPDNWEGLEHCVALQLTLSEETGLKLNDVPCDALVITGLDWVHGYLCGVPEGKYVGQQTCPSLQ